MLLATILTYPMSCKVLQSFSTYSYKFKETFSVLCVQSICVLGHPISFYVFVFECFVLISLYVYFSLFDCRCAKMIWLSVFILCLSLSYSFFLSLSLFNFFLLCLSYLFLTLWGMILLSMNVDVFSLFLLNLIINQCENQPLQTCWLAAVWPNWVIYGALGNFSKRLWQQLFSPDRPHFRRFL